MKKNIAIIGSGTGLTLAWLLKKNFTVTLFEAEDRLGGHINSLNIPQDNGFNGKNGSTKTSAIVEGGAEFLNSSYTNFFKLLDYLGVKTNTFLMTMEFIDHTKKDDIDSFMRILLTPNLMLNFDNLKKAGWNCCSEIIKDLRDKFPILANMQQLVLKYLSDKKDLKKNPITLDEYMDKVGFMNEESKVFIRRICSSSWGIYPDKGGSSLAYYMLNYLASFPLFKEVIGGLSQYIKFLEIKIKSDVDIKLNSKVTKILKTHEGYTVEYQDILSTAKDCSISGFDDVIICTNAKIASLLYKESDIYDKLVKVNYYQTLVSFQKNEDKILDKNVVVHIQNYEHYAETTALKTFNSNVSKKWCIDGTIPENSLVTKRYEHPYMDIFYYNAEQAMREHNEKCSGIMYGSIMAGIDDSHESGITASIDIAKLLYRKYKIKLPSKFSIFEDSCC